MRPPGGISGRGNVDALPFAIFRILALVIFGIFRSKIKKYDGFIFSGWYVLYNLNAIIGTTANFTNVSGGNLVDGLPSASST